MRWSPSSSGTFPMSPEPPSAARSRGRARPCGGAVGAGGARPQPRKRSNRAAGSRARRTEARDRARPAPSLRRSRLRRRRRRGRNSRVPARDARRRGPVGAGLRRDRGGRAGAARLEVRARRPDRRLFGGRRRILSRALGRPRRFARPCPAALGGNGQRASALPDEAILVADDLAPSRFLEIDWKRSSRHRADGRERLEPCRDAGARPWRADGRRSRGHSREGRRLEFCSTASRARSKSRPRRRAWPTGAATSRRSPNGAPTRQRRVEAPARHALRQANSRADEYRRASAISTPDAAHADGIGLVRTEFLFQPGRAPPSEEQQYRTSIARFWIGRPAGRWRSARSTRAATSRSAA